MRRIRSFEERTADLFQEGVVKGTAHSYVGEEAIASAVGSILRDDDYMASNHRGHGHCIAKGAKLDRMMAELMGRDTGYCHGLGGSMHIADMNLNILGANGIVGAAMPLSTGTALAAKLRGTDQVVVAFFGDGGSNQGIFHESLNLASVWKLPVLFICENNQYALSTSYKRTTSAAQISDRAIGYQVPGVTIDGNDPEEVYNVVEEAVARARAGEGPTLIECLTYRWGQHSLRANLNDPRPEKELEEWIARDPMKVIEKALIDNKVATRKRLNEIGKAVETELEEAVTYGKDSPEPNVAMMEAAVYSPHATYTEPGPNTDRELSFPEALNEALAQEMARVERELAEELGAATTPYQLKHGILVDNLHTWLHGCAKSVEKQAKILCTLHSIFAYKTSKKR